MQPGTRLFLLSFRFDNVARFTNYDYASVFDWTPFYFLAVLMMAFPCVLKEIGRFKPVMYALFGLGLAAALYLAAVFVFRGYYLLVSVPAIIFSVVFGAFWAFSYFALKPSGFLNAVGKGRTRNFNIKILVFAVVFIGCFTAIEFVLGSLMPQPPVEKYSALEWAAKEAPFFAWKAKFAFTYAAMAVIIFVAGFLFYRRFVLPDMLAIFERTGKGA